jgi:NADPH-dependent curcumin reductase CurA
VSIDPAVGPRNTRVVFAKRPVGWVDESCFAVEVGPAPQPGPADVLVRTIYLSVDPYLRGRMAGVFREGQVMVSRGVGEVLSSGDPRWRPGDLVWGFFGWEERTVVRPGEQLWPVDATLGVPISYWIDVLGMPGLTAWVGVYEVGRPQPGETVFVSSAAGAVGSIAGQLARLAGARVVGSAGSATKVGHVLDVLGFHACFDYKTASSLDDALAGACPDGIDVYFENVGGPTLEAVLRAMNPLGRIAVCGLISGYNRQDDPGLQGFAHVLGKRLSVTGYSIYDHMWRFDAWQPKMVQLVTSGQIRYHEDIWDGIERLPEAFVGMLKGDSLGKRVIRVSRDPTGP